MPALSTLAGPAGRSRPVLPCTLAAALLLTGCSAASPPPAPAASPVAVVAPARTFPAVDVLRAWDLARARAFATGDLAALRRLYASGSAAGTADVRMLRAYLRRGLRVEGMRMQVIALEVLDERDGWMRLRVTDRLADGAVAVGPASPVPLPSDAASTRVVDLVRHDGAWLVSAVSASGPS